MFKSEGFGIHALERMIIMTGAARFTRLNPGLLCQLSIGEGIGYDKVSPETIPLSPGQISAESLRPLRDGNETT